MTADFETFGVHLMFDGYDADPAALADKSLLMEMLQSVPDKLGMHRIADPQVVEVGPLNRKDPGGISGFVLIAESHFSFHTFPKRGFITLDLYTCQDDLDADTISAELARALSVGSFEVHVQKRGLKYPAFDIA